MADNLLDRQFDLDGPNEAWVADITYIPTREGWLYLAVVEDLYSRMVVGWSMDEHMRAGWWSMPWRWRSQRRLPGEELLAHSDRGSQYASEHYQRLLGKHGIECSMSEVGQCWDNAPVESFFATLKKELVHDEDYHTRAGASASIFEYIEVFYNRPTSALVAGVRVPSRVRTIRITLNFVSIFLGELQFASAGEVPCGVAPACASRLQQGPQKSVAVVAGRRWGGAVRDERLALELKVSVPAEHRRQEGG